MKRSTLVRIVGALMALAAVAAIAILKPTALVYGVQRAGIYAAIAIPMALILGVVHIVNLAHGETMMVAAYLTYFLATSLGLDPLVASIPTGIVMFAFGWGLFNLTIRHTLKAPELNQLILTFGVAMVLSETVNLVATSQPRKLSLDYVTASATVGSASFGIYDFVFPALALAFLGFLVFFLRRTRLGKAAHAVGQNPRGARIVGIDVQFTYSLVFALASMMVGIFGGFFLTKFSIFPAVGGSYTMKSFCLVAMAGIGNLPMVAASSLLLGISESSIMAIPHGAGWSSIVFFVLIIAVILVRSFRRAS